jgi:hypothetical protein
LWGAYVAAVCTKNILTKSGMTMDLTWGGWARSISVYLREHSVGDAGVVVGCQAAQGGAR